MTITRTGDFVDDYLDYANTLPAEIQRLLNMIRELDQRSQGIINQTKHQTKYCLGLASQYSRKWHGEDKEMALEKMMKEIEANQDSALSLCTEKVVMAQHAYDLVDSNLKRLDEDLNNFADDLKQEGKLPLDEPTILPPLSLVPKNEKRKLLYSAPQSKRMDHRGRVLNRDRDFELMPPPGGFKKGFAVPVETGQPIDPNEPIYCICRQVSFGNMIACDNGKDHCKGGEWFHYPCVGLNPDTKKLRGKWYCPACRQFPIINKARR